MSRLICHPEQCHAELVEALSKDVEAWLKLALFIFKIDMQIYA